MIQIAAYLKFERNISKVKRNGQWEERKTPRYDCVAIGGYWSGVEKMKTAKGDIYLNLIPKDKDRSASDDATEYRLQIRPQGCKTTINLTGLRIEMSESSDVMFASGEPLAAEKYKTEPNPFYAERLDGFLFIMDKEPQRGDVMELLVITGEQPFIDAHRHRLALGGYDEQVAAIRAASRPYVIGE